jgi:Flp pilus assembly protein TadD
VELKPDIQPVYIMQINLVPRESPAAVKSKTFTVSAQDLTKKYPKEAVKEFDRGTAKQSEGKTEDAIQHFKKALKIAPTFAMAHNSLGAAYVSRSDFVNAQKELAEAIRLDHSDGSAYFNMANLMLLTRNLGEAGEYLRQGFFRQPDSAFGFFVQGTVLERAGKLPEAEASLQRALQLDPKMPRPHLELVNLYLREQRSTQAMAELHNFLQVAPKDPLAPKAREVLDRLKRASSKESQP